MTHIVSARWRPHFADGYVIASAEDQPLARAGQFFHFFDRANYDSPQFGDLYHAHVYLTKAGASSRLRALRAWGYKVELKKACTLT